MKKDSVYIQREDGTYRAASSADGFQYSTVAQIFEILLKILINIPLLLKDLVHSWLVQSKKSVRGHVALVTGGGNGLGKALCERLGQEGCIIAVTDIDADSARKTAAELKQNGIQAAGFTMDVADEKSVQKVAKEIENALGPVDIVVNNAGLLVIKPFTAGTDADIRRIVDVNLTSQFWTIRQFLPGMVERKRGHIISISSLLGLLPGYPTGAYSATKFGARGLMESLIQGLAANGFKDNVYATAVYPIFVATRQELVEYLKEQRVRAPVLSAKDVANTVVNAMLLNKEEVIAAPGYLTPFVKIYSLLPRRIQCILSESVTPHQTLFEVS